VRTPILNNITISQAGSYEVSLLEQGCFSKPGITNVVVNPVPSTPTITSLPASGNICSGDSVMLFASFVSGGLYEWIGPAGFGSNIQNVVVKNVTLANAGDYNVKVTKSGCTSLEATKSIVVNPKPQTTNILGPIEVRSQELHNYLVQNTSGSIYNWSIIGGTQTSGGSTSGISVTWGKAGTGNLYVQEINSFGCSGTTKELSIQIGFASSLQEKTTSNFSFYPNPVNNKLYIELSKAAQKNVVISCYNQLGQLVKSTTYNAGLSSLTFEMHDIMQGAYLMSVQIDDELTWTKIIRN
jgi:hypothetical protein